VRLPGFSPGANARGRRHGSILASDGRQAVPVTVASLADIVRSRRAAGRPRDKAVLEILEKALEEAKRPK
jgi:hypothetical protein